LATKKPIIYDGHDLLTPNDLYIDVPVYIKIPIKGLVAPIHLSFSYFNSEKKVCDHKSLNVDTYLSCTHMHPEKEWFR
jgi:hypothetical protein